MSEKGEGEYRDLLELWTSWWNGPGRRGYAGVVLPPLRVTAEALTCLLCKGVGATEAASGPERCQVCLRKMR